MAKKQLTELQRETYNLEMANRRLRVANEGLEEAVKNYRENCRMAIAKSIRLEDEIATKDRLIAHLTEEKDQLVRRLMQMSVKMPLAGLGNISEKR